MRGLVCVVSMAVLLLSPCFAQSPGGADRSKGTKAADKKNKKQVATKSLKPQDGPKKGESIGTATMPSDGSIILDLRAQAADGTIGESRLVYPKDHKQYAEILKHLGGLKPGESKPVPPWPDKR